MGLKVNVNAVSDTIMKMLEGYSDDIASGVADAIMMTGKQTLKNIKSKSPKRTGKYGKGWKLQKREIGFRGAKINGVVIYNAKYPYLTHLLEDGHQKVNGGRVEGKPHIKPAYDEAVKMVELEVKKIIEETD